MIVEATRGLVREKRFDRSTTASRRRRSTRLSCTRKNDAGRETRTLTDLVHSILNRTRLPISPGRRMAEIRTPVAAGEATHLFSKQRSLTARAHLQNGAAGPDRTVTRRYPHRTLIPACLPVPPRQQKLERIAKARTRITSLEGWGPTIGRYPQKSASTLQAVEAVITRLRPAALHASPVACPGECLPVCFATRGPTK